MLYRIGLLLLLLSLTAMDSMAQRKRYFWRGWTENNTVGVGGDTFIWFHPGSDPDPLVSRDEKRALGVFFHQNTLRLETYSKKVVATLEEGFAHVTPLDEGVSIGSASNWQIGERFGIDGSRMPLIASASYAAWHGKTAYAGVQAIHGGRPYYGWIKLKISADGQQAEIEEIAFHMDPNQPITTGDQGDIPAGATVIQTSNTLCFSITNEGNLGYIVDGGTSQANSCPPTRDESRGIGMRYKGHSLMYEAGLLLGVDESRVLSTVRGEGVAEQDQDLSQRPGSIFRVLKDGDTQYGRVELLDAHARYPIGLSILQESFSFSTAVDGDFVILRYEITNRSSQNLENMFAGLWIDWDIGNDIGKNSIDFDDNRKMGFARADEGNTPVVGIRVISQDFPVVTSYAGDVQYDLSNDDFRNRLSREGKWDVLSGTTQRRYISGVDVLQIATVGPIQIAPSETATVVFALVAGDNVEDLQINADRALAKYQGGIPISAERTAPIPDWITIGKVFPNPITNRAMFPYTLSRNAHVEVEVYDLLGRQVVHLLSAKRRAGEYMLTWNTDRTPISSGVYMVHWTINHSTYQHRDARFVIVR